MEPKPKLLHATFIQKDAKSMLYNFNSSPDGRAPALSLEILPESCWAQDEEWAFVATLQRNSCINYTDHAESLPA